jgi:predicted phosphodiesterase
MFLNNPNTDIYLIGDIHGEFKTLNFLLHKRFEFKDSLFIQLGDFGVGFHKEKYYINILNWLNDELKENNNTLLAIRGNHDNPLYFNDLWNLSNLKLLSDYSVIETIKGNVLCVGGEASIDYKLRTEGKDYWKNELPVFDEIKLKEISDTYKIDYVLTHGMPTITYPILNYNLTDSDVIEYCKQSRKVFDMIYQYLINNNHPLKKWFSGHYHEYHFENILGIDFTILGINEIKEL